MALLQRAEDPFASQFLGIDGRIRDMRRPVIGRGDEPDLVTLCQGALRVAGSEPISGILSRRTVRLVAHATPLVNLQERLHGRIVIHEVGPAACRDRVRDADGPLPLHALPQPHFVGLAGRIFVLAIARNSLVDRCRAPQEADDIPVPVRPSDRSLVAEQRGHPPSDVERIRQLLRSPPVIVANLGLPHPPVSSVEVVGRGDEVQLGGIERVAVHVP